MDTQQIYNKAEKVRDVLRYISLFKNSLIVIHISDLVINSVYFSSHIKDISFLHEAGLKVIIVPGAKSNIDNILKQNGISWINKDNTRITKETAMPLIKMAAFDVSNQIMTCLAEERLTAVIGNWVRARGKGVLDGTDFITAGEIDKINIEAINTILDSGFIPIFPCIGWNAKGKPYNISSTHLAAEVAIALHAEKLFFLTSSEGITKENFILPEHCTLSSDGFVPAFSLEEVDSFISENDNSSVNKTFLSEHQNILSLLKLSTYACRAGVSRSHLVNGMIDGTLPCEIFSDLGSGTMIYKSNYGGIRQMVKEDIPSVLNLLRPFIQKGILLPRTEQNLLDTYNDYIVYELDGGIKACSSLHVYNTIPIQAEIAAVAVDQTCSHIGIGPKIIKYLIHKAKDYHCDSIFILTTQTADWFEQLGFLNDDISTIPPSRKQIWSPERGSKVFRLSLTNS